MAKTNYYGRRCSFLQSAFGRWLKGLLLSVAVTAVLVVLLALIVGITDAGDAFIRTANQVIKLISIVLGVFAAVRRGEMQGALRGALLGLMYMGAGVLIYALLTGQQLSQTAYLMDILMGVSIGGLAGLIRRQQA